MSSPTEQLVEDVAIVYFEAIGATTKRGVEIDDAGERGDATEVVLKGRLSAALHRLNPDLPHDTVEEVVRILSRPPHPTLIQNNRWFHALLTDGVEVEYRDAIAGPQTERALRRGIAPHPLRQLRPCAVRTGVAHGDRVGLPRFPMREDLGDVGELGHAGTSGTGRVVQAGRSGAV